MATWKTGTRTQRRFGIWLGLLLFAGLVVRVGYVFAQPRVDPTFDAPILDGAYYLEWARALISGGDGPEGAYYLAPLYPVLLAGWLWATSGNFALLYLVQQLATVATAGLLALAGRRLVGPVAGLASAALLLLYGPALFFASSPLGETAAMLALTLALWVLTAGERSRPGLAAWGSGLLSGIAALARPNLLAVGGLWTARELGARRWRRAGLLLAGLAVALLPTTVRNYSSSGHLVPVSSNMGITLFHGNGEGAAGVYTPPWTLGGALSTLRREATGQARLQSGRELDAVEADRWWARQAVRTRLEDPAGSLRLLGRKLLFLLANAELALDYDPGLDRNPWRWGAPLPFAVLLALSAAGLLLRGPAGTGGYRVWSAVAGCALAPLVFYVSSRYRLPLAIMLCLPAGAGLAAFVTSHACSLRRRAAAVCVAALVALLSLAIPTGFAGEELKAGALTNRAAAWQSRGNLRAAENDLREALAFDPGRVRMASVWPLYTLGVVLEAEGRRSEAEEAYQRALAIDPLHVESAANLAALQIAGGRAALSIDPLRTALASRPHHAPAWTNLIVALVTLGDVEDARRAARQARALGLEIDPGLLETIGEAGAQRPDGPPSP